MSVEEKEDEEEEEYVCVCVSFMLLVRGKARVQIMKSFPEFEKLKSPCSLSENRAKTLTFTC